jgi:uncharacterized membrane protein
MGDLPTVGDNISIRSQRPWLSAAYLGIAALLVLLKYAQYRACQFSEDTSTIANVAFNLWHGGSLATSIFGLSSYYAIHFMPLLFLFAPLGALGGAMPMLAAQALIVASMPLAAYALTYQRSRAPVAATAALWLTLTSPFFFFVARASLAPQVCLPAFLLWGAYFAQEKKWPAAFAFGVLAAMTIEQAPCAFFGAGLYLLLRAPAARWRWAGAAACAAAGLLWAAEMRLIASYPDRYSFWTLFAQLGATPREAALNVLAHPVVTLRTAVWPLDKLLPLGTTLWTTGFLGLAAPWEMIPLAICFLPHLLAQSQTFFHNLDTHYSAYILGPLFWAACAGLCKVYERLQRKGLGGWILPYCLAFGALNLYAAPRLLDVGWDPQFFWSVPLIAPKVPPGASVFAMEYAAPWLSYRRHIEIIYGDGSVGRNGRLFKPDFVLLDPSFLLNDAANIPVCDRLLTFLSREGYIMEARTPTLFLLKNPSYRADRGGEPPALARLPDPDAGGRAYGDGLRALIGARR